MDTQSYKIGVTRGDVNKRLKKLQTGNSTQLYIKCNYETQYPFRLESMLHKRFEQYNILNEWYDLDECTVNNFAIICKELEDIIISLKNNPFFSKNLK